MKDELIDAINRKNERNSRFITVSAFSSICANFLLKFFIIPVKYLKLVNATDLTSNKKSFWNFG
jgi:hypothetical protein